MADESKVSDHIIKETIQINLLLKKLLDNVEKKDHHINPNLDPFREDNRLEQLQNLTDKLNVNYDQIKKSDNISDFLTEIHHNIRSSLVPISAYTDMLLQGHYGTLTSTQIQKIEHVKNNIEQLKHATSTLFTKEKVQSMLNTERKDQLHEIKELKQEKILLEKTDEVKNKNIMSLNQEVSNLQNKLTDMNHKVREQEQEKLILNKTVQHSEQKTSHHQKKYYTMIALSAVVITVITLSYSAYVVNLMGEQYRVDNLEISSSGYIIQNLRGDIIDTWLSWRIVEGNTLYVNIPNAAKYPEKIDLIKKVILSDEVIEIDDSLLHKGPKGTTSQYYVGWSGALNKAADTDTVLYIPHKIEVIESDRGEGDITITLTNMKNGDGYSGFTKSIADQSQNQILKSEVTIYEVDTLSKAQFETILRHELGHAFGLAHSTALEDLMAPMIETDFPYISECDIDAIISLYDGSRNSNVVCEK